MGVGREEPLPPQQGDSFQVDAEPPLSPPPAPPKFDPSRMIGIIRRKALIKDLAAVYHAECLAYCQELLELQARWEEQRAQTYSHVHPPEDMRKDTRRPTKRSKKA